MIEKIWTCHIHNVFIYLWAQLLHNTRMIETIVLSFFYFFNLVLLFTRQCISISLDCKSMWTISRWWHTTSGLQTECPNWLTMQHPSSLCTPTAWPGRTSNRRSTKLSPWKPTATSWCWESLRTVGPGRWTRIVVSLARRPSMPTVLAKRAHILRPKVYWPTTRFALTWSRALRQPHR